MKRRGLRIAALLVATSTVCGTGRAAEGRIPIFEPTVLDHNDGPIGGKYVVTRNVVAASGRIVDILGSGVEDIEIDINGFTLRTATSFVIYADGVRTLIIRNGICQHLGATVNIRVRNTERLIVEGVNATGGQHGIFVDQGTRAFIVRNNTITDTTQDGILASPTLDRESPEIADGVIESNLILDAGARGIEARWGIQSLVIRNNRVIDAGTYGITTKSTGTTTVAGNHVNGAGHRGIRVDRALGCLVERNVVRNAGALLDPAIGGDGIVVDVDAEGCLVRDNASTNNWEAGLRVNGKYSQIEGNLLVRNGLAGLHLSSTSGSITFGRNTARGNGTRQTSVGSCVSNPGTNALAEPEFCDESAAPTTNTPFGDNLAPGPPPG